MKKRNIEKRNTVSKHINKDYPHRDPNPKPLQL